MNTLPLLGFLDGWWDSLGLAKQVFYAIGIVAGLVSIVLAVLAFVGMEHHDSVDVIGSGDLDHGGGGIFSVKPLTGFFLGFGWAGGIALDAGLPLAAALPIALVSGGALMALIVAMFRAILSLRSDGTMRVETAVGAVGTVYVSLPPDKAAGGQITVTVSGRQETFSAICAATRPLPSGEKVRVVAVLDGRTLLVEPL
jgi:membrane protein implicated in regulation of membrane protease activity